MKITRRFTKQNQDPFASVEYEKRTSRISNPDGTVVFEMNDAEIPKQWSQLATDIMVSKYFRKAGVPQEDGSFGPEKSVRQVIHRLAGCWHLKPDTWHLHLHENCGNLLFAARRGLAGGRAVGVCADQRVQSAVLVVRYALHVVAAGG